MLYKALIAELMLAQQRRRHRYGPIHGSIIIRVLGARLRALATIDEVDTEQQHHSRYTRLSR